MIRKVKGTTVVITGATSGIGRATALEFARAGAQVVVAGRRAERLHDLVVEIEAKGGVALAVRTDVSEQAQVEALLAQTIEQFGRIDTLVNNAGVGLAAKFEEQALADFERVMQINFWGAVYACKAAVPQMKRQGGGGVIINVSSVMGKRGMPFETAYCASKFALAGFSEALRAEIMSEGIDVSTIFPGAVETEIFEQAANQTGLEMPGFIPKYPARELAKLIVQDARFPQPEIIMALDALGLNALNTVAPRLLDLALGWTVPFLEGARRNQGERAPEQTQRGNLYDAAPKQARNKPETSPKQARNKPETSPKQARNKPETSPKQARNKPETSPKQARNKPETSPKQD
jgi:NAD(P)-dependent dehydrogenase (short-subunit alcohol dehydrogenase family)